MQSVVDPLLVATGLIAPGAGPGLVAWLATFDGRVPGRATTWWILVFNRAMLSTAHVVPSLVAVTIAPPGQLKVPVQTAVYVAMSLTINYFIAARAVSYVGRTAFWPTLVQNVAGIGTLTSSAFLGFSGGILYLLLAKVPGQIGYFMAPALFGFILAVRGNVADAQRQAQLKDQTLELAAQALDARDRYTESHSIRVAELAGQLGERLDRSSRECELLRTAGSLHDLGKIGVRDDILNKPGPLTREEWEVMRRHPDIGADMIAQHSALTEVAPLVRHHHERWDASGYPAGLKGEAIPFGARILSVADSFDTITGTRLYRRSLMTPVEAVEDISHKAGVWYDPNVVDALRAIHGLVPLEIEDRPVEPRRLTTLRLLRANPGFARLLIAMAVSALGDPLTLVAALVTVYAATSRDARAVALAFIAQALGTVLMSGVLGGVVDRFHRRSLIVSLEFARAALLLSMPFLLIAVSPAAAVWVVVPVLFVLAAINSIVQPARQASVSALVGPGQIGKATAVVTATVTACGAIGYGLAGLILAVGQRFGVASPTMILFVADAATFAVAGVLVLGISDLGGGAVGMRLTGSLRTALRIDAVRPHLIMGTIAAFLLAMSFPALIALAYRLVPDRGAAAYSGLEVVLSIGLFGGSLLLSRFDSIGSIGTFRTAGGGLLLAGIGSLAMTLSSSGVFVAAALLVASIGNPIYVIANQTALMQASNESNRGTVMASRFSLVQTASIAGTAVGGFVTNSFGPIWAYGFLAIGLILLGMFAVAAGGGVSNPLHGGPYDDSFPRPRADSPEVSFSQP
ncbi:MAG TPA: HD domain-containing phosphohydrolase [Candidatus Dormibacteraeota bacterium]|nr:HD domain-containing phosphohydrolase [Candidatus Dormibacteraeota bacterium]